MLYRENSELKLQSKRDLPRRAKVARGSARIRDHAESSRTQNATRVSEIGMVQDIEHIRAKLQARRFGNFGVFDYGEVRVIEVRPGHGIAGEITKLRYGRTCARKDKHRRIDEPRAGLAGDY